MLADRTMEIHYANEMGLENIVITSEEEDLSGIDMHVSLGNNHDIAVAFRVLNWYSHMGKYDGWDDNGEASVSLTLRRYSGAKTEADKLSSDEMVTVYCNGDPYQKSEMICWAAVKTEGVRLLMSDKQILDEYLRIWNSRYINYQTKDNAHFSHDNRGGGKRTFFILRRDIMTEAGIPVEMTYPALYEYADYKLYY